jgi:uncharacterized protein YcbX
MGTLASVHIYPLKGCRAVDLAESAVEPCGLAGDRRWLLVNSDLRFINQRKHPSLARLAVRYGPGADITVRVAKPCGRCLVTTTDQVTGERGRQPLAMLGRRRRIGKALAFGQNLIPDSPGLIRVGDPVEITRYARLPLAARLHSAR